jgi:hypothetical protein
MSLNFGFSLPAFVQPKAGSSNLLGPSLDLQFIAMDTSYATGETLDLSFTDQQYEEWALPAEPQGLYFVWDGYAPWEPYLDLDFIAQRYLEET